ncbi:MAG: 5,6-dimethylbenzimidazole synthase [Rhodospirillales bacterium]
MDHHPTAAEPPAFGAAFRDELTELFRWRRDVRHFLTDPLPEGALDDLLATAQLAPSVGLSQPWRWVTVTEPARRKAVLDNFKACNAEALAAYEGAGDRDRAGLYAGLKLEGLERAPCHLAVFADPEPEEGHGLGSRTLRDTFAYSAVGAVTLLWLAARARGIGLGWVSILEPDGIKAALDPSGILNPGAMLPRG